MCEATAVFSPLSPVFSLFSLDIHPDLSATCYKVKRQQCKKCLGYIKRFNPFYKKFLHFAVKRAFNAKIIIPTKFLLNMQMNQNGGKNNRQNAFITFATVCNKYRNKKADFLYDYTIMV